MPPKIRRCQRFQKAQLLFHQQPLEAPKHHRESPKRPITHTRQVPSKPIDQGTITSWVLPQFDMTESRFSTHGKLHHRNQARHSSRKSTCKFPCLSFESPRSSSSETVRIPSNRDCSSPSEKDTSRRPLVPMLSPQSCGELSAHTHQSLPHVFIVPDIQTPESSPVKKDPVPSDQRENGIPTCLLLSGTSSPEPGPVLVKDTPEEKYGIKVTWRRRKHLFAYLKETGKLSRSQFLVKS